MICIYSEIIRIEVMLLFPSNESHPFECWIAEHVLQMFEISSST